MRVSVPSPCLQHLRCRPPCQCRLVACALLFVKSSRLPLNLEILPSRLHPDLSRSVRFHSGQLFGASYVYRGHSPVVRPRRRFHWACPCRRRRKLRHLETCSFLFESSVIAAKDSVQSGQFTNLDSALII